DDGAQVEPDEGLLAIHALFKDKIYTYRLENGEGHIGQVHFKAYNRGELREVWYGPDVTIRHLPSFRVWVSAPQTIKGNWLIASFGSDAFWKTADYSAGRDAFRQQQKRASGSPRYFQWSNPAWNTNNDPSGYTTTASSLPENTLDRAYRQLGVARDASGDQVKAAFRKLAREVHPDVSSLPKDEAEVRFKKLYEAYAFIKATNGW
ncbi:MAG: J domain-containing protein, partial [Chloroflexota bacterium]